MSTGRTKDKIQNNKNKALTAITSFLENTFLSDPDKVDKLSFWFQHYINYLNFEDTFSPERLQRYKRGDIVKVDFGFRLGSELGGLHYCVVIDNYNPIKATTLTVVPLSSLKKNEDAINLPRDRVFLGFDLSNKIQQKIHGILQECENSNEKLKNLQLTQSYEPTEYEKIIKKFENTRKSAIKIIDEFNKMKFGSVALVGQITTVSKMRIYDPKDTYSVLHGIRLSTENLDLINQKIKDLYVFH